MDIVLDSNKVTKAVAMSINRLIDNDKAQIEAIDIAQQIELPVETALCNEKTKDSYRPDDQKLYDQCDDYQSLLKARIAVFTEIRNRVITGNVRCLSKFRSDLYAMCFHHNMDAASTEWHSLAKTAIDVIDFLLSIGVTKLNKIEKLTK